MPRRKDPRIEQVVNLLPADGSPINHAVWLDSIAQLQDRSLRAFTQEARRSGDVLFEIGDMNNPAGSLTVRRAFIAAPAAQPLPIAAADPNVSTLTPKAGA